MRQAVDAGNFIRIEKLSPQSSKEELTRAYTWRFTTTGGRAAMNQPEQRYRPGNSGKAMTRWNRILWMSDTRSYKNPPNAGWSA